MAAGLQKKISESFSYRQLVLPVIRDWKSFWFLMTDKRKPKGFHQSALYIENRILKNNLKVSKVCKCKREIIQDIRGKDEKFF